MTLAVLDARKGPLALISFGENTAMAAREAAIAKAEREAADAAAAQSQLSAEQAADLVLPENRFVAADLATAIGDAEAATTEGTYFLAVGVAEGEAEVRQRTASGSTWVYTELTKAKVESDLATKASLTDLASTDEGKGSAMIIDRTTGATLEEVEEKLRFVPGLKFVNNLLWTDVLNGEYTGDLSTALASAMDSGENLRFPGKDRVTRYPIDGALKIARDGQRITSDGIVRFDFLGQDTSANAFEMLSTRRDTASPSAVKTFQEVSGIRFTGPPTAKYKTLIWAEQGLFVPAIKRIFTESGTNKGFAGEITEAFIKIESDGGISYVNDAILEDIYISSMPYGGAHQPCGIWLQGGIEGRANRCVVFYFTDCWRWGDENAADFRALSNWSFVACQGEPGHPAPSLAFPNKTALRIYAGTAMNLTNCRLDPGQMAPDVADSSYTNNDAAIRFCRAAMEPDIATGILNTSSGEEFAVNAGNGDYEVYRNEGGVPSAKIRNGNTRIDAVTMSGGQISLFGSEGYAVSVEGDPYVRNTKIDRTVQLYDIRDDHVYRNTGTGHAQIDIGPDLPLFKANPRPGVLAAQSRDFPGTGSIASGSFATQTYLDFYTRQGTPMLASLSQDPEFCAIIPSRTSIPGKVRLDIANPSASTRSPDPGKLNLRPFLQRELSGRVFRSVAPGTIAAGSYVAITTKMPSARAKRPVVTDFVYPNADGMQGVIAYSYCETDGEAITVFHNLRAVSVGLTLAGQLTLATPVLDFDVYTTIPFDIGSLAAGQWSSQLQTGLNVAIGDHVLAWYSGNQDRVWMHGQISAAGTARVSVKNVKTSPPASSPTGEICVGIFKRWTAL